MKHLLALILIALTCAGCSPIGPDYERPALTDLPENWRTLPGANPSLWKIAEPADELPKAKWWTGFRDKTLTQLIEKCLENNYTLQASLTKLDQAIAQAEARGAALLPTVTTGGVASRSLISANRPLTNYNTVNYATIQNNFAPVVTVSYEIDWLGKVRRDVEAARNTAEQAEADSENVRLLLTAQVASSYFLMRQYDEEIRVLTRIVEVQNKLLSLVQKRYDLGSAGRADLEQQRGLTQTSEAQLEVLKSQRNVQEDLLATLTGVPAPSFKIAAGRLPEVLPAFPVNLPSS